MTKKAQKAPAKQNATTTPPAKKKGVVMPFYSKAEPPKLLFTLYPDGTVEASEEVDYLLWLEVTGINAANGTKERARVSKVLLRLAEYWGRMNQKPAPEEPDPRELLNELADIIGRRVAEIAHTPFAIVPPDEEKKSKRQKIQNDHASIASQELGKLVQYAAEGINRWKMGIKQTLGKPNLIWMIHLEVKTIIRSQKRLPTKNEIRQGLEADGWNPKGKTAWSDAFTVAGLGDLEQGEKYIPPRTFKRVEAHNI